MTSYPPIPKPHQKRRSKQAALIQATIHAWAIALSMADETIRSRLTKAGISWKQGDVIQAHEIFIALLDEKKQLEAEMLQEELIEKRRDNRKAEGQLLEFTECEKALWTDLLSPLRTEIEQMPKSLSALVNPADPTTAEKMLVQWVEKVKTNIKEKLQ